ncbi:hypothetical protein [Patiriisocius marinus]|uniref:Uncharacterized protein n=1 Tax=Patiriisocius marinus TaxID=1397112 RepID=A0A5J4J1P7_9FLAO|nr:hypothetical protein [Patiriisocius marinus]GER60812.1 hypothetical protein ULMA_29200 [Patiriisocius marinus]
MIHFAADNLPWNKNKYDLLNDNLEDKNLIKFSAIYNYHDRWKNLGFTDFHSKKTYNFFGFTPL